MTKIKIKIVKNGYRTPDASIMQNIIHFIHGYNAENNNMFSVFLFFK